MKHRRLIAIILTLTLLLGLLPASALADERPSTDTFCSATGGQHSWRNWTTDYSASCTEDGARSRVCGRCGYRQTETIKKTGHSWGKWKTTVEATCTRQGEQTRKCSACGKTETRKTDKLAHTWGEWTVITEPTDHSAGTRTRSCQVCGTEETQGFDPEGTLRRGDKGEAVKTLQEGLICYGVLTGSADGSFGPGTEAAVKAAQAAESLAADGVAWPQTQAHLGHRFGEWETLQEMTDFTTGIRQRVCSRCSHTETEETWPEPTYKRGDSGDGVKALQEKLNAAGYNCGTADGIFGGKTEAAVQGLEEAHGFTPDGIAWPGVQKWLEGSGADTPDDKADDALVLTLVQVSAEQEGYVPGDEVAFCWTLTNNGPEDLILDHVSMSWGDDGVEALCSAPLTLLANGAGMLSDTWTTRLEADWITNGAWNLTFFGRGYLPEEAGEEHFTVSKGIPVTLAVKAGGDDLSEEEEILTGGMSKLLKNGGIPKPDDGIGFRSLTIVKQTKNEDDYYDGAKIPVKLRLTIDDLDSYDLLGIQVAPGDSVSDEDWMTGELESGGTYEFTYMMVLDPDKTGWKTRNVTVRLRSHIYNDAEEECCEVRPSFTYPTVTLLGGNDDVIDYPAFLYLTVDKKSFEGYPNEQLNIPVTVTTDAADKYTKLTLHVLTNWKGNGAYHSEYTLTKTMKGHEKRSFLAHAPVRTIEGKWENYTLTFYVTGVTTDKKGYPQVIESQSVTVPLTPINGENAPGSLMLKFSVEPNRGTFWSNDHVTLSAHVYNTGDTPLENVRVVYTEGYEDVQALLGDFDVINDGDAILPDSKGITSIEFDIPKEFVDAEGFEIGLRAYGTVKGTKKTVASKQILIKKKVDDAIPKVGVSLTADMVIPQDEYPTGKLLYCRLHVTNDSDQKVKGLRVYAIGDNRSVGRPDGAPWFDLGHGMKGWQSSNAILELEPGESITMDMPVTIPTGYTAGDIFRPAWVADADLWDGKPARSNPASVALPVRGGALSLLVFKEDFMQDECAIGETSNVIARYEYSGDKMPDDLAVRYWSTGRPDDVKTAPATAYKGSSAQGEVLLTLDAHDAVGGVWTWCFQGMSESDPQLVSEVQQLTYTMKGTPAKGKITLEAEQITAQSDPAGWHDSDVVTFKFHALYEGEGEPKQMIVGAKQDLSVYKYWKDSLDTAEFSDELNVVLDASKAVDGVITVNLSAVMFLKGEEGSDIMSDVCKFTFPLDMSDTTVIDLVENGALQFSVTQLNDPTDPEGWWHDGDQVHVKLEAAYKRTEPLHFLDISVYDPKVNRIEEFSKIIHEATWSDEIVLTLDASQAVDDKCAYTFYAGAFVTAYNVSDYSVGPVVLTFDMAPGGKGADGGPDTQINWDAIHAAAEVIENEGSKSEGTEIEKADGGTEADASSDGIEAVKADGTDTTKADGAGADKPSDGAEIAKADGAEVTKPDGAEYAKPTGGMEAAHSTFTYVDEKGEVIDLYSFHPEPQYGCEETVVTIPCGDHDIPATVCMPLGEGPFPAVVMLHGTGSSRDEAGDGFKYAAQILATEQGIASIRIDFPGNGDSTADYMLYDFHSAMADAKAAADYMAGLEGINGDAIGVMGWSQGGTDALLACAREPETFKSVVTWAGAPDMMLDGFFSQEDYEEAKEKGYFVMEFDRRDDLNVSLQWCEDVANTDVLAEFRKGFDGPVLAIAGTEDTTVDPIWSERIVAASGNALSAVYFIEGMDHTFNVFTEEDLHSLHEAVEATGLFFSQALR